MSGGSFGSRIDERVPYVSELNEIQNDREQNNNLFEEKSGVVGDVRNQYIEFLKELKTEPDYIRELE